MLPSRLKVFRVESNDVGGGVPESPGFLVGRDDQDLTMATRLLHRMPVLEELSIPSPILVRSHFSREETSAVLLTSTRIARPDRRDFVDATATSPSRSAGAILHHRLPRSSNWILPFASGKRCWTLHFDRPEFRAFCIPGRIEAYTPIEIST